MSLWAQVLAAKAAKRLVDFTLAAWSWPIIVPWWEKKLLLGGGWGGLLFGFFFFLFFGGEKRGSGQWGWYEKKETRGGGKGGYIRKVGGVFVYVCGQEVLHGCCVEHDGAGFVELTGVVDAVEGARLRGNEGWRLRMPATMGCSCSTPRALRLV